MSGSAGVDCGDAVCAANRAQDATGSAIEIIASIGGLNLPICVMPMHDPGP